MGHEGRRLLADGTPAACNRSQGVYIRGRGRQALGWGSCVGDLLVQAAWGGRVPSTLFSMPQRHRIRRSAGLPSPGGTSLGAAAGGGGGGRRLIVLGREELIVLAAGLLLAASGVGERSCRATQRVEGRAGRGAAPGRATPLPPPLPPPLRTVWPKRRATRAIIPFPTVQLLQAAATLGSSPSAGSHAHLWRTTSPARRRRIM